MPIPEGLLSEPCPHGSTFGACVDSECDDYLTELEDGGREQRIESEHEDD